MHPDRRPFVRNVRAALADAGLQAALKRFAGGFPFKRRQAVAALPEFEALCDAAAALRDHVLDNLDHYLVRFEAEVVEAGGHVHWARDAAEARSIIVGLCRDAGARTLTKSKSMVGEEVGLNPALEAAGIEPVETDLGEYILQLRGEPPSHIIAPAIHLSTAEVADAFRAAHGGRPAGRPLDEPQALLDEARAELRARFVAADVGITGANMLVAETGSVVLVTNEGNAELTHTLPRVHIVLATLEKMVPTVEDAATILRVLARSATGQALSVYTGFVTGPRRPDDPDGPQDFHVVLLDNGRSAILGGPFRDVLRCIRCGACLNHCPVYGAIGGHAYGSVYPGPVGAVLTPLLAGAEAAADLPRASTLCGRCQRVCPVRIPLPRLLQRGRQVLHSRQINLRINRILLKIWIFFAIRPALYHRVAGLVTGVLALLGRRRGGFRFLPGAGHWCRNKDLPAPEGGTFIDRWRAERGEGP